MAQPVQLTTVAKVFDALGGAREIVALTGAKRTAVYNWRINGRFPARTYVAIKGELLRRGLTAPIKLWGMLDREPPKSQAQAAQR
jgi:hypothetical protein